MVPRPLVLAAAALALAACRGGADRDGAGPRDVMTRAAVVSALGGCTLEVYRAFLPDAERLSAAVAALGADGAPAARAAARAAWTEAMASWQRAEVFQYGPAGVRKHNPGGRELRDQIYAWPLVSDCLIEQQIVSKGYEAPGFGTGLVNVRGLAALEYLLFHEGTDNACGPTAAINSGGTWAALGPDELDRRKRAYAATAAAEVARRARELVDAWEPGKGNFLREVTTAGAGSAVYRSAQAALNAMSHALFYLEHPVKDVKLARPLGLKECAAATCPETLESRYARRSKDHVARNLEGFETLAFGCGAEPLGFDHLLRAVNAAEVADRLAAHLAAARARLAEIPGDDFAEALAGDPAPVRRVYDAIKSLVDVMKAEMTSALDLDLPAPIIGDND